MKDKKPRRTVPRVPRGFRDLPPEVVATRRRMIDTVCRVYERYGFTPLETPAVEYLDCLGKFLPEADQPDGGVFAWRYDDDDWVALRYDLTAPLSRYVAENFQELGTPFRRYQVGQVWRQEKPGPGRFREFTQLDIDVVGAGSMLADAEVACVIAEAIEALGVPRGSYEVRMNDRKVLNGLLEKVGCTPERAVRVLRSLDKIDRVGPEGVRDLLGPGRVDPSGDAMEGAGLEPAQIDRLLAFLGAPDDRQGYLRAIGELVSGTKDGDAGLAEMTELDQILTERGVGDDRVRFSAAIVRGLAYYTGPVLEVVLTFPVEGEGGKTQPFGSVAGGGRYDGLVGRFLGQQVPSTGASIGVDRLLAALQALKKLPARPGRCPVLVTTIEAPHRAEYQKMAAELRAAGLDVELYVGSGGVAKQFKYADRRGFTVAVVAGGDELGKGEVAVKDLRQGVEQSQAIGDRAEWLKTLPGQVTVPRERLVATVKEFLARYADAS
ncbi:MAG: histidine--tRNA ligase [Planctomycetes bacterium]|nr:histidine--tRNA ligase [Planctomycetota bacterium]